MKEHVSQLGIGGLSIQLTIRAQLSISKVISRLRLGFKHTYGLY
jgi:hypothetical protein